MRSAALTAGLVACLASATASAQTPPPDARAFDFQQLAELRRIARSDLEKQDGVVLRQMVRLPSFIQLVFVLAN